MLLDASLSKQQTAVFNNNCTTQLEPEPKSYQSSRVQDTCLGRKVTFLAMETLQKHACANHAVHSQVNHCCYQMLTVIAVIV